MSTSVIVTSYEFEKLGHLFLHLLPSLNPDTVSRSRSKFMTQEASDAIGTFTNLIQVVFLLSTK